MSDNALLTAENVACARGGRLVFSSLSFTLAAGQAMLLRGPNGAGKSSLLRIVAGLTPRSGGSLRWGDTDLLDDAERHAARLVYAGHLDAVKPALTVSENLAFWAGLRGADDIVPALQHFGLDRLADMPAAYLSAGQKKRLNLARLAACPAALWLLDEPTVSLDATNIAALEHLLARHLAAGGRAMIASHVTLAGPAVELRLGGAATGDYSSSSLG